MLMDFGLSHILLGITAETATRADNGSLRWLAPESLAEKDAHTRESDVWALGMTYLVRYYCF